MLIEFIVKERNYHTVLAISVPDLSMVLNHDRDNVKVVVILVKSLSWTYELCFSIQRLATYIWKLFFCLQTLKGFVDPGHGDLSRRQTRYSFHPFLLFRPIKPIPVRRRIGIGSRAVFLAESEP